MKKQINPVAATVVIVLLVCIVGYVIYARSGGGGAEQATNQSNPMPKEAGDFLKQAMQGKSRPGQAAPAPKNP